MLIQLVRRFPRVHLLAIGLMLSGLGILVLLMPGDPATQQVEIPISLSISPKSAPGLETGAQDTASATTQRMNFPIRRGDNLSTIFKRAGISPTALHSIMSLGKDVGILRKIVPGTNIELDISAAGELTRLSYMKGPLDSLIVKRSDDHFRVTHERLEPETLEAFTAGMITKRRPSLFESGKAAGLTDNIVMELSYVFQWDISFALDLRDGDSFALLYEEDYHEGEKISDGDILSAEFTNLGRSYAAVLYETEDGSKGYFTPDGKSMRKAFLRDPVHFSRVSSSFNLRRLHPIRKKVMPHRGIDYAANRGTPVVAAGDGTVSIVRQNSASGKYIVLQHGQQFTTKYLHLSRFTRGLRAGKKVQQGDVIGYVGATGWATGPHLHYEFLVNGVHRNPRTVELPQSNPIPASEMERFLNVASQYLERIDKLKQPPQLASVRSYPTTRQDR